MSGNYTYYGDINDSPAECKRKALEGARIDALSQEFGTIVSQDVLQADRIDSNGESNKFLSLSATEVKGSGSLMTERLSMWCRLAMTIIRL